MRALAISRRAQEDLKGIAVYTRREWGARQAAQYLDAMRGRLALLLRHPEQGTPRDDVRPGYRSVPLGQHVAFYRVTESHVEIVRVLRERMDLHRALARGPADELPDA
jgi:toxin ParE1/3/4